MIREDYLIRMIRQFFEALARLNKQRERGDLEAARATADALYEELGIPKELVEVVDTPTLVGMLKDPERMRAAAKLFWEEALLLKAGGDPLTAYTRFARAWELYKAVREIDPQEDDDASILELSREVPGWAT
jgi:hypothetical protein